MSINNQDYDNWVSDIHGLPCGLYFYFINSKTSEDTIYNIDTRILGNCGAIQSVQFVPFINDEDLDLKKIKYDINRFGDESTYRQKFNSLDELNVYRIDNVTTVYKDLGTFKCYTPNKSSDYNWRNESRLYNYPYSFAYLSDFLNSPIEIKYHLCGENENTIRVRNTISDRCSYGLYVVDYKGDKYGMLEAMVSGDSHEIPCSSDAYGQWVSTNKNQLSQNITNMQATTMLQNQGINTNAMFNMGYGLLNTVSGGVNSVMTGDIGGLLTSGIGNTMAIAQTGLNANNQTALNNRSVQNAINMNMAQANDMKSVPNTMISMGSDVYYGLVNGDYSVWLYRMGLQESMYERLGYYFTMYGYKQNKLLPIQEYTRNRYYFNYIKTIGCNVKGDIPRKYLEEIKSIFDNGVTLWHVDREGVEIMNYTIADNKEVN